MGCEVNVSLLLHSFSVVYLPVFCACTLCTLCLCHPVWRLGTVTAWPWWTTCRNLFCCVCQRWICTDLQTPTNALLVPLAGTDSPPQVAHVAYTTAPGSTDTHTHSLTGVTYAFIILHISCSSTVTFTLYLFCLLLFLSPDLGWPHLSYCCFNYNYSIFINNTALSC